MRTPISILISSVERLYNEGILTNKEYKVIMARLVDINIAGKKGDDG